LLTVGSWSTHARPIRYVRDSFFYGRTFLNDPDLDAQAETEVPRLKSRPALLSSAIEVAPIFNSSKSPKGLPRSVP